MKKVLLAAAVVMVAPVFAADVPAAAETAVSPIKATEKPVLPVMIKSVRATPLAAGAQQQPSAMDAMHRMNEEMLAGVKRRHPDAAFAAGMVPHHQGAVEMAKLELVQGKDLVLRKLAENIVQTQQQEIEQMNRFLASKPAYAVQAKSLSAMNLAYIKAIEPMHEKMMQGMMQADPDTAFAAGMLAHHEGAVEMAKLEWRYGKNKAIRELAQNILHAQQGEIELMDGWLKTHAAEAGTKPAPLAVPAAASQATMP